MPRNAEFDRGQTLQLAMHTFWVKGYEATSVTDLTTAMGIGRQSMYNSFGTKHTLFLECLDWYCANADAMMFTPMRSEHGGLAAIETYFEISIRNMTMGPRIACFLVNSAVEVAPHDAEVAQRADTFSTRLSDALRSALTVGVANGEINVDDVQTTAHLLRNTWFGLAASSKAGVDADTLRSVIQQTLKFLSV